MMDERSGESSRSLYGHAGPVYSVSFSPDRLLLLSCSEDSTIRLWSLQIWTCVVVFKGHLSPVWDVKFSPLGYYFASAGSDRTARLWATDNYQPLRLFAGHFSDVDVRIILFSNCLMHVYYSYIIYYYIYKYIIYFNKYILTCFFLSQCIQFHPNSNYVATGSSDRRVCLWDCVTGNYVRLMTGHKSPIHVLAFSVCGRYLASAGSDCKVLVWDLAHGHLVAELCAHDKSIHSLTFSRCGNLLVSGSLDSTLKLWDFTKLAEDTSSEDVNISHNPDVKSGNAYLLRSYATKSSPVIALHFTRRNLLLAISMFDSVATTT